MASQVFSLRSLVLLLTAILSFVSAWDIGNQQDREGCQYPSGNPLAGCDPERTLFVDGIGGRSTFKTVQSGQNPLS